MRVVFDTNIFIAAALRGGFAKDIIELANKEAIRLLTSEAILAELQGKLLTKFNISEDKTHYFIKEIKQIAEFIEDTEKVTIVTRDPDDNKVIACALSGKADLIVSSDQDLIALKKIRGIAIIHPKTLSYTFPEYFKKKKG